MPITMTTPAPDDVVSLAETLDLWQLDGGPLQLHPGDLGWFSMRGTEATASAMRVWLRDGRPVAIGLLDGDDLRLAVMKANYAAGFSTTREGVASSLIDRYTLERAFQGQ